MNIFLGVLAGYMLYLAVGWAVLVNGLGYTIAELRREVALNGVGDSVGDPDFNAMLACAYLFVWCVWPVSVQRKIQTGRVVGRDMREKD